MNPPTKRPATYSGFALWQHAIDNGLTSAARYGWRTETTKPCTCWFCRMPDEWFEENGRLKPEYRNWQKLMELYR